MLHFVRSVSLYIWCVERCVCFLSFWFSKPAISFTVITFFSVRAWFSLPVSCLSSVLHVFQISVSNIPSPSLLQFIVKNSATIFWNVFFEPLQDINQSIVSTAKWHIRPTSPFYPHSTELKIIAYENIVCFCLQTSQMYVELSII